MTAEGAIAITAAILASSVALLGFGLDSVIEGLASIIVIWRFTGTRRLSEHAEQRAQRLVAITFFLLAPYIIQDAIRTLISGEHPAHQLARDRPVDLKHHRHAAPRQSQAEIGQRLGSGATAGEGTQNMLCAYLAAGVLTGLALNAAFGLWWADPVVALGIGALALYEGRQTWRGEGCCAASPLPGEPLDACDDDCCLNASERAEDRAPHCSFGTPRGPRTGPVRVSLATRGAPPSRAFLKPMRRVAVCWSREWWRSWNWGVRSFRCCGSRVLSPDVGIGRGCWRETRRVRACGSLARTGWRWR